MMNMSDKNKNDRPRKSLIQMKGVHKSFGSNHVLRGVNLDLYENEILVMLGKSGCGKSVLIKCIVGLIPIDDGEIEVLDHLLSDLSRTDLDELRTDVGFLFQGSALYDSMTVRENLLFPLRRHRSKIEGLDEDELVREALKNVGLEAAIDLMPSELSGGMKRRVALARTLILRPKIILYDEPTTGLDPITAKEIINLMISIQEKYNNSSLIITHDMDCARVISDRLVILEDGINFAEGTYESLSTSDNPRVKAFFK